jgi:hypothetical protein
MPKLVNLKAVSAEQLEGIIAFRHARALALRREADTAERHAARAEQAARRARKELNRRRRAAAKAVGA